MNSGATGGKSATKAGAGKTPKGHIILACYILPTWHDITEMLKKQLKKYFPGFTGSPFYNVSAGTASWQFLPVTGYHGQTGQGLIPCRSWNTGI